MKIERPARRPPWFLAALVLFAGLAHSQTGPVNLGFEEGQPGQTPPGWFGPESNSGYRVTLTTHDAKSGRYCAEIAFTGAAAGQFGGLRQSFDATPYRGKRLRFRAAVRAAVAFGPRNQAQMWLRVDRKGQQRGFFDNMDDRPITSAGWQHYEIIADIDEDGETVNIGILLTGEGKAWVDDVSFEVLGGAGRSAPGPARPIGDRGLKNLAALARLLGYVRHFYPGDEAARADWEAFAIDGVRAVESAANPAELARTLESLFRPVAPAVRVFAGGRPSVPQELFPSKDSAALKVTTWRHHGFGAGMGGGSIYRSGRTSNEAPGGKVPEGIHHPSAPYEADLGGGVGALVPLAVFADAQGTLPRAAPPSEVKLPGLTGSARFSARDRATRLAAVMLAWNVFQHFYPYFDVVKTDWAAALETALRTAATDKDETAFADTLRRLVVALHDGHGNVISSQQRRAYTIPVLWDWIEGRLVVTHVGQGAEAITRGDVVLELNGRPAAAALAETEALISGATPQWIRFKALGQLALGDQEPVTLLIEPFREPGARRTVTLNRSAMPGAPSEPRPDKIAELEAGISYVDLTRITDSDWQAALPQLEKAQGIVFDMRGYPGRLGPNFLCHLSDKPMTSAQWHVPLVKLPDRRDLRFERGGEWNLAPRTPYLKAKRAFVTDGRAISYAESCMGIVEHYRLGEIVGGPTAGTNGNVNPFVLPGGYRLIWTGMRVLKHDGSQHHGIGIRPTIPVSRTRAGVAAGRDEALERAVQAVKN